MSVENLAVVRGYDIDCSWIPRTINPRDFLFFLFNLTSSTNGETGQVIRVPCSLRCLLFCRLIPLISENLAHSLSDYHFFYQFVKCGGRHF